jgi:hypothetical protein
VAFGPLRATTLLGPKQYHVFLVRMWVYSLAWAVTLVLLTTLWKDTSAPLKFVLVLLLIVGTPSIQDLFQTYGAYKARWETENNGERRERQPDP